MEMFFPHDDCIPLKHRDGCSNKTLKLMVKAVCAAEPVCVEGYWDAC